MKIFLSPSTQEKNSCKQGDTEEQHINKIVDLMEPLLRYNGIQFDRNTPEMSHVSSKNASNKGNYDLHYALHSNAFKGTNTGSKIFYASEAGKKYAEIFRDTFKEIYSGYVGIEKPIKRYTELYETNAVSIIDEIAFHDNNQDAKWIHDHLEAIAKNKAKAICRCFGRQYKEPPAHKYYKVLSILPSLFTHVIELDPMTLRAGLVSNSGNQLAKTLLNFINGNFFSGRNTIGWLISEGKVLNERHEEKVWIGNPKGTLIVYKDGHVEVGWKRDGEITLIVKDIWFCCQGFNLYPPGIDVLTGIRKEGFFPAQVGYTTERLSIGYNKSTNKIVITKRAKSDAARAVKTMANLGCKDSAICLDGGDSVNLQVDGKSIILTDRVLTNVIYW